MWYHLQMRPIWAGQVVTRMFPLEDLFGSPGFPLLCHRCERCPALALIEMLSCRCRLTDSQTATSVCERLELGSTRTQAQHK